MKMRENPTPILVTALIMMGLVTTSALIFGLSGDRDRLILVDEQAFQSWFENHTSAFDGYVFVDESMLQSWIEDQGFVEGYYAGWEDARICIIEAQKWYEDRDVEYYLNDLMTAAEYGCLRDPTAVMV